MVTFSWKTTCMDKIASNSNSVFVGSVGFLLSRSHAYVQYVKMPKLCFNLASSDVILLPCHYVHTSRLICYMQPYLIYIYNLEKAEVSITQYAHSKL